MTALKRVHRTTAAHARSSHSKGERLSMRIDRPAKAKLERAAAYSHKSISEYVISRAIESAEADIRTHEKIILPETMWDAFYEAFDAPPKPNAAMRALLKAHDQMVISR